MTIDRDKKNGSKEEYYSISPSPTLTLKGLQK